MPIQELMTKANLRANLIAWLKTKDPSEHYDYRNSDTCALAQFFRENGYPGCWVGSYSVNIGTGPNYEEVMALPEGWDEAAMGNAFWFQKHSRTFGRMLKRVQRLPE